MRKNENKRERYRKKKLPPAPSKRRQTGASKTSEEVATDVAKYRAR